MTPVALQEAIYNRLANYSALTALLASDPRFAAPAIFDHVPQDAVFPYVVIGDTTAIEWDTDDTTGAEYTVTLHVWSEYRGRKEAKKIQAELYNALHRHELAISGATTVTCEWEYAETVLDTDGLTRQGITRFRVLAET